MANPTLTTRLINANIGFPAPEFKDTLFESVRADPKAGVKIELADEASRPLATFTFTVPESGILELGIAFPVSTYNLYFGPFGDYARPFLLNYRKQ